MPRGTTGLATTLAFLAGFVPHPGDAAGPTPPMEGLGLAFSDEFDGGRLSPGWATCYATGECLHGDEAQAYRGTDDPDAPVLVGDGRLTLTARPRPGVEPGRGDIGYVSGMVSSHPSLSFTHGYVEARIRIPAGRGLWPAFWLFQSPGAKGYAEIDVMESLGHEPSKLYATIHAGPDWASRKILQAEPVASDFGIGSFADGFHVYAVDWTRERTRFLVDGKEVGAFPTPPELNVPMHLMLNLAVGGRWAGLPQDPSIFPARMEIDWIRVWRRSSETPSVP